MQRFARWIVHNKAFIGAIMLALVVFSVFSSKWVTTEDDVTKFLPKDTESVRGMEIMDREFITYASEEVMVEDVWDEEEALLIQEAIFELDDVMQVEFDTGPDHFWEGNALYYVTYAGEDGTATAKQGMADVRETLSGYSTQIYNSSLSDVSAEVAREMVGIGIIIVIVVIIVLVFTSGTYGEILVLLLTFGSAALINTGTNYLLGTISMISDSVSTVMQLALSIDYAIILCNRYKEEHARLPVKEAVVAALTKAVPEVFSSSLTTIAGLLSMTLMQFTLGRDMGLCLIKAVAISLMSVFVIMPVLLVVFGGLMDRTKHRSFLPRVDFLGHFAYLTRFIMPVLLVAVVVFSAISFRNVNYSYDSALIHPPHESANAIAANKIHSIFPANNMIALMVPSGDYEREAEMIRELEECPEVNSVMGLANVEIRDGYTLTSRVTYDMFMDVVDVDDTTAQALFAYYAAGSDEYQSAHEDIESIRAPIISLFMAVQEMVDNGSVKLSDEQLAMLDDLQSQLDMGKRQLEGENYSRILIYVDLPIQSDETAVFLDTIHVLAGEYYDDVCLTGNAVAVRDFSNTFDNDCTTVSVMSVVMVMLILLLTFKSVAMPVILILIIQGSIWINFAIPVWQGNYVHFMSYLIVSAVQMGANIDYAIVVSSRYNDLRAEGIDRKQAMIMTMNFSFPTIITSGTIMAAAGLLIGYRVSYEVLSGLGMFLGIGTLISLAIVSFALPQVLIFTDSIVRRTTLRMGAGRRMRLKRGLTAAALILAICLTVVVVPSAALAARKTGTTTIAGYRDLITRTEELQVLAREVSENGDEYDEVKYDFAELLTTDNVGAEKLAEGEAEYAAGQETLEKYKKELMSGEYQYMNGVDEYEAGLAAYQEGLAALEKGQAEYDAAAAQLIEGQAQYDAGVALLAEKQAEYDAGAAQLAAAKEQYAAAEAELNSATASYNALYSVYSQYQSASAKYDEAIASGDAVSAIVLKSQMIAAETVLRNAESSAGMSAEQAIAAYQSGQAQLAEAQQQIAEADAQLAEAQVQLADGQAQLNAAKAQLDDGKAQLTAAKAELEAGQTQLNDAQTQLRQAERLLDSSKGMLDFGRLEINSGESQLNDARKQLEEGRETLEKNQQDLQNSMAALDEYSEQEDKLEAGIQLLLDTEGVSELTVNSSDPERVCSAALVFFREKITELNTACLWANRILILCGIMLLLAMAALILGFAGKSRLAMWLAFLGGGLALVVVRIWRSFCGIFGDKISYACFAVCVFGVLFAIVCNNIARAKKAKELAQ